MFIICTSSSVREKGVWNSNIITNYWALSLLSGGVEGLCSIFDLTAEDWKGEKEGRVKRKNPNDDEDKFELSPIVVKPLHPRVQW